MGPKHHIAARIFQYLKDHPELIAPGGDTVEIRAIDRLNLQVKVWTNGPHRPPIYLTVRVTENLLRRCNVFM